MGKRLFPEPRAINGSEAPGNIIHQRWRLVIHQLDEESARELLVELRKSRCVDLECFCLIADKDDVPLGEIVVHRETHPLECFTKQEDSPELSVVG